MGIQILQQNSPVIEIQAHARKGKLSRSVQLWIDVQKHQLNLICNNALDHKKPKHKFVIAFSLSAFDQLATTGNESLRAFAKKIKKPGAHAYSRDPLPMDAALHQCIYRITHYTGEESVKNMYLYAQVVELLVLLQLAFIKNTTVQPVHIKNEYDKERILYARDYLLTHMDAPPGLPQLAAVVGINEFKLKCGFKEMFGQPPFAYLADVRLEMAHTALQKKEKTITQIAFELGYASLQHFSMAYKKKFGISPVKVS